MSTDEHWLLMFRVRPCGVLPGNSLLQRVARENEIRVAVEYLPIIDRRPEIGLGKRPAPIESDAVVWARAGQDKTIAHADRGKSTRQDRLGAGVVIYEFVFTAIAIGGNALDQVVDANHGGSIRLRASIDNHLALSRAGDGDPGGEQGALVSGDGEAHGFRDYFMVGGWSRRNW